MQQVFVNKWNAVPLIEQAIRPGEETARELQICCITLGHRLRSSKHTHHSRLFSPYLFYLCVPYIFGINEIHIKKLPAAQCREHFKWTLFGLQCKKWRACPIRGRSWWNLVVNISSILLSFREGRGGLYRLGNEWPCLHLWKPFLQ